MFGLLLVATLISVGAMTLMYLAVGRSPAIGSSSTLILRPAGDLPELIPEVVLPIADGRDLTVRGYVDVIRKAKHDRRVARLLIKPGGLESPFWAKIQEIREALVDFRRSGKPVYAFLEYGGGKEYFLASAADKVYLLPTSTLDLTGLASYEVFLRGTFDWVGTYPDFLHVGDFKTAVNTYTEKTFTPAHREMSESLNRDQFDQLVRAIADGRRKGEDEVRALIDRGPFQPEEALRVGLVDDLAYEDELDDVADVVLDAEIDVEDYARVTWEALGVARRSRIAVVNAVGTLVSGESGFDPVNGPVLGSDSIVEQIREARDSGAKAMVVRIDSPGGSSVASDVIWRELMITKDKGLPVVVSMSDLAASGGYYMAAAGDVIVAQPGTLTGSIGVYTGKFVIGGHVREAWRERRDGAAGEVRRHVFARSAVHAGGAGEGAGVHAGHLRSLRRARGGVPPDDTRESGSGRAGAGVDGATGARDRPGRRARGPDDRRGRGKAAREDPRRRGSPARCLPADAQLLRGAERSVPVAPRRYARAHDRGCVDVPAGPARAPVAGGGARAFPPVPSRRAAGAHAVRVCQVIRQKAEGKKQNPEPRTSNPR